MTKNNDPELYKQVEIANTLGLHARAAAKIAKIAAGAQSKVSISKERENADASSIVDILSLACAKGEKITIRIEDPTDREILAQIAELVESGFGE